MTYMEPDFDERRSGADRRRVSPRDDKLARDMERLAGGVTVCAGMLTAIALELLLRLLGLGG